MELKLVLPASDWHAAEPGAENALQHLDQHQRGVVIDPDLLMAGDRRLVAFSAFLDARDEHAASAQMRNAVKTAIHCSDGAEVLRAGIEHAQAVARLESIGALGVHRRNLQAR